MRKYLTLFTQHLSNYSSYRLHVLINIIQSFVTPLFLLLVLSRAIPTGNIQVLDLIPYYLLVGLIYPLTRSKVDEYIEQMTTSGEVNNFLVKPLSIYKYFLFRDLSWKTFTLSLILPLFLLVFFIASPSKPLLNNFGHLFTTLFITLSSLFLTYNFSFLIGLTCFWLDEFWAIHNVKHVIVNFFGGVVLPYTFFPDWSLPLLKYSPFPYLLTWPVRFIRGQFSFDEIIIASTWTLTIYLLILFFQKRAILRYSHTGG